MLPLQIGMNTAIILLVLLLAVPLQLFLSHYINTSYSGSDAPADSGEAAEPIRGDINSVRIEAMNSLKVGVSSAIDYVYSTYRHYSKWKNFKELFVVPYNRGHYRSGKYKSQSKLYLDQTEKLNKFGQTGTLKPTTAVKPSPLPKSGHDNKAKKPNPVKDPSSKAKDTEEYLYKEVYFTHSKVPRATRGPQVKLKVGQVVRHKTDGYYGVVVGWDEVAKAPEEWLRRFYSNRQGAVNSPNYLVLVDARYHSGGNPFHYLPQEDVELVEDNIKIKAPEISDYFEGFEHHRHLPRPWLKEIYPSDE